MACFTSQFQTTYLQHCSCLYCHLAAFPELEANKFMSVHLMRRNAKLLLAKQRCVRKVDLLMAEMFTRKGTDPEQLGDHLLKTVSRSVGVH